MTIEESLVGAQVTATRNSLQIRSDGRRAARLNFRFRGLESMNAIQYSFYRTRLFAFTQAALAIIIIGAFVYMSVTGVEVNVEFGFIAGAVTTFFFEGTRAANGDATRQERRASDQKAAN